MVQFVECNNIQNYPTRYFETMQSENLELRHRELRHMMEFVKFNITQICPVRYLKLYNPRTNNNPVECKKLKNFLFELHKVDLLNYIHLFCN